MIFKFAKLPEVIESEDEREEIDKVFAVPEADPVKDLNWSKLFMPKNPNFCILKCSNNEIEAVDHN